MEVFFYYIDIIDYFLYLNLGVFSVQYTKLKMNSTTLDTIIVLIKRNLVKRKFVLCKCVILLSKTSVLVTFSEYQMSLF